jgi:TolB-like protein
MGAAISDSAQGSHALSSDAVALNSCLEKRSEPIPHEAAIREQLERILASRTFERARQQRRVLDWLVSQWLAGNTDQLDSYHLLLAIFPDQRTFGYGFDPTARVYTGRLRDQLERYYSGEGCSDCLKIEIPKGTYIPVVHELAPLQPERRDLNTVMVLPFQCTGIDSAPEFEHISCISDQLIRLLTRNQAVRVIFRLPSAQLDFVSDARLLGKEFGAHFIVVGRITCAPGKCDFIVHLSETSHGYSIWSEHYQATTKCYGEVPKQIVRDLIRHIRKAMAQAE